MNLCLYKIFRQRFYFQAPFNAGGMNENHVAAVRTNGIQTKEKNAIL